MSDYIYKFDLTTRTTNQIKWFGHYKNLIIKTYDRLYDKKNEYKEKHHILPRCMGGPNKKQNYVYLLPEEHYIANQLLAKIFPENSGLLAALILLGRDCNNPNTSKNKLYGWIRKKFSNKRRSENKTNCERVRKRAESLRGRTKNNYLYLELRSNKMKGKTKENCIRVKKTADSLRGTTKDNCEWRKRQSNTRKGRTKENCEYVKKHSEKMKGRTKETHEGVKKMSDSLRGRTKETHPGIAARAEKIRGRTKDNDDGVRKMADSLRGRTKETHEGLAKMAENKFKLPKRERNYYFELLQAQKITIEQIYEETKDKFNNISIKYLEGLFYRIKRDPSLLN